MQKTKIEYLTHTWNPIAMRCAPVGAGCQNCWHIRLADRMKANPMISEERRKAYTGGDPVLIGKEMRAPLRLKKHAVIGVQFMGDLFHPAIPFRWIDDILEIIETCRHHTFVLLTKRPDNLNDAIYGLGGRLIRTLGGGDYLPNLYIGVSIWDQDSADWMITKLLYTWLGPKIISLEPMLGPVDLRDALACPDCGGTGYIGQTRSGKLIACETCGGVGHNLRDIDGVIVGGESGHSARPMHPDWVRSIRDQCAEAGIPFYFKQWGEWIPEAQAPDVLSKQTAESALYIALDGSTATARRGARAGRITVQRVGKKNAGRILDGRIYNELPWEMPE